MSLETLESALALVCHGLGSPFHAEREEAVAHLAQIVDTSLEDDAAVLAEQMRATGALPSLVRCLEETRPSIHQPALVLVGNLASEAFDPQASLTKALLKREGCFERLLPHLYSDDWRTLLYSLGAVQNLSTDLDYVDLLQRSGVTVRL